MIPTLYKTFRHWSSSGSVWIVSDTHFDDPDREFMGYAISTEEHFEIIRKTCHKNDTLIHLGDVGEPSYFKSLKSHKVLILGNHDKGLGYYEKYFDEVYDGPLFIADKILLSHEPVDLPFCLNISGHNHSNWGEYKNVLNVAANIAGYEPISLKEIIQSGVLKDIPTLHRIAIDRQMAKGDL